MFNKKKILLEEISEIYAECGLESLGVERRVDMPRLQLCEGWCEHNLVWNNEVLLSIDWNFVKKVPNGSDYRTNKGDYQLKMISDTSVTEMEKVTFNSIEELRESLKKHCEEIRLKKIFISSSLVNLEKVIKGIEEKFEKGTVSREKIIKELKRVLKLESLGELELAVHKWNTIGRLDNGKKIQLIDNMRRASKQLIVKNMVAGKEE